MRIDASKFRAEILDSVVSKGIMDEKFLVYAKEQFGIKKEELIQEFDEDSITQEILGGPNAENISGTLNGRSGNLYSFIGFKLDENEGEESIKKIRDLLENEILIRRSVQIKSDGKVIKAQFGIFVPTEAKFIEVTPMPWGTGESWLLAIEVQGLSNLNHYIYREYINQSRSTSGLQIKQEINPVAFSTKDYVLAMMKRFVAQFK